MTNRNAAEHEFHQDYSFTSAEIRATADSWYTISEKQHDVKHWLSACEHIAFNLGEQWVSLDSIRGAADSKIKVVEDAAFEDMAPRLGLQIMLERVLKELQQGVLCQKCSHQCGVQAMQGFDGRPPSQEIWGCSWTTARLGWTFSRCTVPSVPWPSLTSKRHPPKPGRTARSRSARLG